MANPVFRYLLLFIVCVMAQILIFNQIVLFNIAVPIFFIYFIVRLPINLSLTLLFTFSFLIGLIVDIFSDTPGVNALACTIISAIRLPIYYAYMSKDDITNQLIPGVFTMGIMAYCKYLITFILIYCLLTFIIEYFNFADVKSIVIMTAASTAVTFILLLATDCLIPIKTTLHKKI